MEVRTPIYLPTPLSVLNSELPHTTHMTLHKLAVDTSSAAASKFGPSNLFRPSSQRNIGRLMDGAPPLAAYVCVLAAFFPHDRPI